jgi:hypothetical protein
VGRIIHVSGDDDGFVAAGKPSLLLNLPTLEEGVATFFEKRLPNFPGRS